MADVLSQSQIDDLLRSVASGDSAAINAPKKEELRYKVYDFRAPKKFTKEQMRTLNSIFEVYARLLSSYLTGIMRLYCRVSLVQIEEQRYYEFSNALPDYCIMPLIDLNVANEDLSDTTCIMQIANSITYTMIDRLLGGKGEYRDENRDFTEIEIDLMRNTLSNFVKLLKEPWLSYIDLDPQLTEIETNSRVIQAIGADDIVIIVALEAEINDVKNVISICIPALNLEEIMGSFSGRYSRSARRSDPIKEQERKGDILDGLRESEIEVTAILSETQIDLADILNLQINDVIPLNKHIDSTVTLRVGDKQWFEGKLGIKNNKKAVRVDNILQN